MDTTPRPHQIIDVHEGKRLTLPIFFFLIFLVCTFFPHVYTFLPFLGTIKIALLAGILLVSTYFFTRHKYQNTTAYSHPISKSWLIFMAVLLLGLIYAADRGLALNRITGLYKIYLMFIIMIKIIDSPRRLDLIMGVFAFCGVGMAIGSITGAIIVAGRTMSIGAGLFADPNDLCFLLNCTLPFLLYLFLKKTKRIFVIPGIIIVINAIVLTFSRGGFLGLCMTGLAFSFLIARKSLIYLLLVLLMAIAFWSFAPAAYKARISTITAFTVDEDTGLTGTRLDTWIPAVKWGLEHPLTGRGPGSTLYFNGMTRRDWHVTHNAFVQVLAGTGVIGFSCYMLLFIIPLVQYRGFMRQKAPLSNEDILRIKIIMVSLFSYATTAFFLPQGYSPILYLLTGFYVIQAQLIFRRMAMAVLINESN